MLMTSVYVIAQKALGRFKRQLQQNLNKIENLATSNGFKFSKSKTQSVHFCHLRKQHDGPVLLLYGSHIQIVEESKFLGLIFDKKNLVSYPILNI